MTKSELLAAIAKCDADWISDVIATINTRTRCITAAAARAFRVGNKVEWNSKRGFGVMTGTVTKVNRKTINVTAADGVKWRVSPEMLRSV